MVRPNPSTFATSNAKIAAYTDLRPLTAAEHRRMGLAPSKRLYTTQKAGVQKLRVDKTVSRRQATQQTINVERPEHLPKVTLEKRAQKLRAERGGTAPTDRYYRTARRWAQKNGTSIGDARSDPAFRKAYHDLTESKDSRRSSRDRTPGTKTKRTIAQSKKRLRALYNLGEIDYDEYDHYMQKYQ